MKYILVSIIFLLSIISSCRTTYHPDGYYYQDGIWYYYHNGHRDPYHYYDGAHYYRHPYNSPGRGSRSGGGRGRHRH